MPESCLNTFVVYDIKNAFLIKWNETKKTFSVLREFRANRVSSVDVYKATMVCREDEEPALLVATEDLGVHIGPGVTLLLIKNNGRVFKELNNKVANIIFTDKENIFIYTGTARPEEKFRKIFWKNKMHIANQIDRYNSKNFELIPTNMALPHNNFLFRGSDGQWINGLGGDVSKYDPIKDKLTKVMDVPEERPFSKFLGQIRIGDFFIEPLGFVRFANVPDENQKLEFKFKYLSEDKKWLDLNLFSKPAYFYSIPDNQHILLSSDDSLSILDLKQKNPTAKVFETPKEWVPFSAGRINKHIVVANASLVGLSARKVRQYSGTVWIQAYSLEGEPVSQPLALQGFRSYPNMQSYISQSLTYGRLDP
jgi:hypothetical protein